MSMLRSKLEKGIPTDATWTRMQIVVKIATKDNFTYTIAKTEVPWEIDKTEEINIAACLKAAEDLFNLETSFLFEERPVPFYIVHDECVVVNIENIKSAWVDFHPIYYAEDNIAIMECKSKFSKAINDISNLPPLTAYMSKE